eukprot:6483781-Amphidinium_carterae.1
MNKVEVAQRSLEAKMLTLQDFETKCRQSVSEDRQRIKQLEATVQELLNKQVKEQAPKPKYLDPLHVTTPARGRSRLASGRNAGQQFLSRSQNSADSECGLTGSPVPNVTRKRVPAGPSAGNPAEREKPVNLSGDSSLFTLTGAVPSLGELSSAQAQTDTEASQQDDMEFLVSIKRQLICMGKRGATKVYTTGDSSFQVNDVVIFQDLDGYTEAHRVK